MENLKKTLTSGAQLEVTLASFPEGHKLYKAVAKKFGEIDENDTVQKVSFQISSSEEIESALWPCMFRATYDGRKINIEIFEDAKVRSDFLEIQREVLGFNLIPFSGGVGSSLSIITRRIIDSQR